MIKLTKSFKRLPLLKRMMIILCCLPYKGIKFFTQMKSLIKLKSIKSRKKTKMRLSYSKFSE